MDDPDFKMVLDWFDKCRNKALAHGKAESAMLWADGYAHLKNMVTQRDFLLEELREARRALASASDSNTNYLLAYERVDSAIAKVEKS